MNLLSTLTIGDPWYAQYTVPWMRRYASRCGADFLEIRQRHAYTMESTCMAWARLDALARFARQTDYERLMVVDADCVILPHCPDLFAQTENRIRAVADMGTPAVDARYVEWCRHFLGAAPRHDQYFNAGMILIGRKAAQALLPHLVGPYPDEPYWEQDFLNFRVQEAFEVDFLPLSFNWLAPQFEEAARAQNIVHFVGRYKSLIPGFCESLSA